MGAAVGELIAVFGPKIVFQVAITAKGDTNALPANLPELGHNHNAPRPPPLAPMLFIVQRGNRGGGEPTPTRRQKELRGLAELVQAELERAADAQVFEVKNAELGGQLPCPPPVCPSFPPSPRLFTDKLADLTLFQRH